MAALKPTWGDIYLMSRATTGDDLLLLPDDGAKNELFEGSVVREEMTGPGHAYLCQRLGFALGLYAQQTGFQHPILQNGLFDLTPKGATKKTVLAPDLAIMRGTAIAAWAKIPTIPPLLAVEVVSPTQSLTDLAMKAQFYRGAGVDEVWVIDHNTRTVEIWNAAGTVILIDGQTLTSVLLPGFSIAVTKLIDG